MPESTQPAPILVVKESFVGELGGQPVTYRKGEAVHPDDPAIQKWPEHFEPLTFVHPVKRGRVEQATAAPGEKRGK